MAMGWVRELPMLPWVLVGLAVRRFVSYRHCVPGFICLALGAVFGDAHTQGPAGRERSDCWRRNFALPPRTKVAKP